jgi:hypothetical protein
MPAVGAVKPLHHDECASPPPESNCSSHRFLAWVLADDLIWVDLTETEWSPSTKEGERSNQSAMELCGV